MRRILLAASALSLIAQVAMAAQSAEPVTIVVIGTGVVRTEPESANVSFEVRGEGSSADAATMGLVKSQQAVEEGIAAVEGVKIALTTGKMAVEPVRGKDCKEDYDDSPKLSSGACAITGYVSTMQVKVVVMPASSAGTVVGVAARLGAEDANVAGYDIRDQAAARRRAVAAALIDAKEKARTIAEGAGGSLGALVSVKDSASGFQTDDNVQEVAVTAQRRLQPRPPVQVTLKPEPIATSAQLVATYAILP